MRAVCVSLCLILALEARLFSQERLTPELLQTLKAATAFVTTGEGAQQRSGSGILIHVKGDKALVATNAHVLADDGKTPGVINCILNSGTSKEAKLAGKVVILDFPQDLALVEISGANLPAPISVQKPAEVYETLPVFIVGFPFGEMLGLKQSRLNHTVSRGSVSSIRTNAEDEPELYQLDGGLNPGNSGGPIVDASGKLVGMAVAKVRGTEIGFAIPAPRVATLVDGYADIGKITVGAFDLQGQQVEVVVELTDPLSVVKEVRGYIFQSAELERQNRGKSMPRKPSLTSVKLADSDAKPFQFTISGESAQGLVKIPLSQVPPAYLQVAIVTADGRERFLPPRQIKGNLQLKPTTWSEAEPKRDWTPVNIPSSKFTGEFTLPLPDKLTGITPAGGGRFLALHFAGQQKARILDLSKVDLCGEIPFPAGAFLTGGRNELLVGPVAGKLQVWSLPDLKQMPSRDWKLEGQVLALTQGWNASEPILAVVRREIEDRQRTLLVLLDAQSLQPLPFDGLKIDTRQIEEVVAPETEGGFVCRNLLPMPSLAVRPAGLGWDYTLWNAEGSNSQLYRLSVRGKWLELSSQDETTGKQGHYLLNATGTVLFTGNESRPLLGSNKHTVGTYLPSFDPQWNILVSSFQATGSPKPRSWRVTQDSDLRQARYFSEVSEMSEMEPFSPKSYGQLKDGLTFDQRLYWSSQAELLVSIPEGNQKVVMRGFAIPNVKVTGSTRTSSNDKLTEPSELPPAARWSKLNTQEVAVPMPAATFEAGEVKFSSNIVSVQQGGGGRYLILTLENGDTNVVDLAVGKVVKRISRWAPNSLAALGQAHLAAGGLTKLVVVAAATGEWRIWNFADLNAEPTTGYFYSDWKINSIAMGSASEGPLAVGVSFREKREYEIRLLDLEFKPIRLATPTGATRKDSVQAAGDGAYAVPLRSVFGHIWPAALGNVFVTGNGSNQVLQLYPDELVASRFVGKRANLSPTQMREMDPQRVRELMNEPKTYRLVPSADGNHLLADEGVYDTDLREFRHDGVAVPTSMSHFVLLLERVHPDLSLAKKGWVIDVKSRQTIYTTEDFPEMATPASKRAPGLARELQHCRYFLIPQLDCMVTIPAENNRLVLRQAKFDSRIVAAALKSAAASAPIAATASSPARTPTTHAETHLPPQRTGTRFAKSIGNFPQGFNRVVVAGKGRYVCAQRVSEDSIVIFDLSAGSVLASVKVQRDALIAGFDDGLAVVDPAEETLSVFNAPNFKLARADTDKRWRKVCEIGCGFASKGPLWTTREDDSGKPAGIQLIDLVTLMPVKLDAVKIHNAAPTLTVDSEQVVRWEFVSTVMPWVRPSGNGRAAIFTDFTEPLPQNFVARYDGVGRLEFFRDSTRALYDAAFLADGEQIAGARGLLQIPLKDNKASGHYCVPSLDTEYYIACKIPTNGNERWELRDVATGKTVTVLPDVGQGKFRYLPVGLPPQSSNITLMSNRLFVSPAFGGLIAFSRQGNEVLLQPLEMPEHAASILPMAGGDSGSTRPDQNAPASAQTPFTPALGTPYRIWTDATGKFQTEAKFISVNGETVRLLRKDGRELLIPAKQLSQSDQEYLEKLRD